MTTSRCPIVTNTDCDSLCGCLQYFLVVPVRIFSYLTLTALTLNVQHQSMSECSEIRQWWHFIFDKYWLFRTGYASDLWPSRFAHLIVAIVFDSSSKVNGDVFVSSNHLMHSIWIHCFLWTSFYETKCFTIDKVSEDLCLTFPKSYSNRAKKCWWNWRNPILWWPS